MDAAARGPGNAPLLAVDNVTLQYKTEQHLVTATYRVGFEVYAGERYVVLGPSGCGKSTILKAVAGFMQPVEGEIRLSGKQIKQPGSDRMMVFQEFDQLLPWKTVLGNVLFPLLVNRKMPKEQAIEHAQSVIAKVNLSRFENVYPHMLSGGMKQRVAIARALAIEPDLARRGLLEPRNHPQQRRLAAARRPDEHREASIGHREVDAVDHLQSLEALAYLLEFKLRHRQPPTLRDALSPALSVRPTVAPVPANDSVSSASRP